NASRQAGQDDGLDVFFFSSRRRHTSSKRDWSSDVCSSDLSRVSERTAELLAETRDVEIPRGAVGRMIDRGERIADPLLEGVENEIGRASCRERVQNGAVERRVEDKGEGRQQA